MFSRSFQALFLTAILTKYGISSLIPKRLPKDNIKPFELKPNSYPTSINSKVHKNILKAAASIPISAFALKAMASTPSSTSISSSSSAINQLSNNGFTDLGGMRISRVLNGMWQVSGAHGFDPNKELAVAAMSEYADAGLTTFDLADHYGPAEDYVGAFRQGSLAGGGAKDCQFFTKWVPRPEEMTRKKVDDAVIRSMKRMKTEQIDLLQFHWWDYSNKYYYDAVNFLMLNKEKELIKNIGLTNFDTEHMVDLIEEGAPIVSNQVSFSVLDTRPLARMVKANKEHNVQLLCYGTLLGGFLSKDWLGKSEPNPDYFTNVSLRKYFVWIKLWGGWELFQELLTTLNNIAVKHGVSLSNVAERWVLDQPTVAGVIIGARLGYKEHVKDNLRVFSVKLDELDNAAITAVQKKGKNLMSVFGDCGGEYRRRA